MPSSKGYTALVEHEPARGLALGSTRGRLSRRRTASPTCTDMISVVVATGPPTGRRAAPVLGRTNGRAYLQGWSACEER